MAAPSPTFRNAQTGNSGSSTSTTVVVTKPTNLAVNDLMLAVISMREGTNGGTTTVTPPDGWTVIGYRSSGNASGAQERLAICWKLATLADTTATNFTFTISATKFVNASICAYYDCNPITPINVSDSQDDSSAASTTETAIAVTTTQPNTTVIRVFGKITDPTWTEASGTERVDINSGNNDDGDFTTHAVSDLDQAAAGSTGTVVGTSNKSSVGCSWTIAIAGLPSFLLNNYQFPRSVSAGIISITEKIR